MNEESGSKLVAIRSGIFSRTVGSNIEISDLASWIMPEWEMKL